MLQRTTSSTKRLRLVSALAALLTLGGFSDLAAADIPVLTFPDGTGVRKLSAVPAPGVHPRIFFSPEDLPTLRTEATTSPARKAQYAALRKTLADQFDKPTTAEGQVLALLAKGTMPSDAQFAATTQMGYLLGLAGIDVQISNDQERGAFLAKVLSAWGAYQRRAWVRKPDPVGLHNSFDTGLCLAYDFIAPWMSEEQRAPVRTFIAKMSDGINIFTYDWPEHMRMWNWAGLHCYQGWGSLAIEGEEGWNPKLWDQAKVVARDFCRFNIHESGALTEDLTYFSLGFQGSGLVLMAAAKRGQPEVWATTSNLSKLKYHLANQLHPWGGNFMSHQDGGGNGFYSTWTILKYMYPQDPMLDYAWRQRVGEDYSNGGMANDAGTRAWLMVLFNTESLPKAVPPQDWKLPTTYFCPKRSYLVARTGWDQDALKLDFEAKTDYPTVGHNHADANNFTFAALGREWATEIGYHGAAGHLHNNVLIDGRSESGWPTPGGHWVDLVDTPQATIGVSDARHPYTWQWANSGYGTENAPPTDTSKWELETLPEVREFIREQVESGKGRQSIFEHYGPVLRSEWNPVEKAFRTATLVRGKRPYLLIVDDIKKDEAPHRYEWAMQVPEDLEVISGGGRTMVLGAKEMPKDPKAKDAKPTPDKRRLLVQIVDVDLPSDRDGLAITLDSSTLGNGAFEGGKVHQRLVIPARTAEPRFKVLLYPHREGDALPDVLWNDEHTACEILFPDQQDRFQFAAAEGGRTALSLSRDGALVAKVNAAPPAPEVLSTRRVFTDRCRVELALPGADQELRYTTDGSEPSATSTFYEGPFDVTATTILRIATFARRWDFGDKHRSAITEATFVKQALREPVAAPADLAPGLTATVFEGFWNTLPNFTALKPLATTVVSKATLPPGVPAKGFGVRLAGFIRIPADGVYTFGLECDDAGRIWIGDQVVADNDGQHIVRTRSGDIALKAGLHPITIANCDGALALGTGKGDGSWAFKALWAPAGAALAEITPEAFVRTGTAAATEAPIPTITALPSVRTDLGLEHTTYDRTTKVGTLAFLDTTGAALVEDLADNLRTPDSSPNLLHVYRGFVQVPHTGIYELRLDPNTVGEVLLGETVVARSGFPGNNVAMPVRLEVGPVPYTVKIGAGKGQVQWKGPGQSWQPISSQDVLRELRPLASIAGRPVSRTTYELFGPTSVSLTPAKDGHTIVYTLDGSEPSATSAVHDKPIEVSTTTVLRARYLSDGKPVGAETTVRFTASPVPELGLLGVWSADRFVGSTLANRLKGLAGDLVLPDGTAVVDDADQGKVLRLNHSSKVMLIPPAILANEVTIAFRVKTTEDATMMRYGYAHTGIFMNFGKDGSINSSGGRVYRAAQTDPGVLSNGTWHQVTATYGGSPFRVIETWVDGVKLASGRSSAPCLTKELELLQGFTGDLAEIRLYNRVLSADDIGALNRGLKASVPATK